jgi:hypothetical protein
MACITPIDPKARSARRRDEKAAARIRRAESAHIACWARQLRPPVRRLTATA